MIVYRGGGGGGGGGGADSSKVGDLNIVSWLNESNASIVDIQGETVNYTVPYYTQKIYVGKLSAQWGLRSATHPYRA